MRRQAQKNQAKMGSIRIISGQFRGRKLPVLSHDGLRPTTDRSKETLFNWLMKDIRDAHCLDMFAGSGSLGFEAISRGAAHVTFCEMFAPAVAQLNSNASQLQINDQVNIIGADACNSKAIARTTPFDVVFIDPPFHQGLVEKALTNLIQLQLITTKTLLYIEHESTLQSVQLAPASYHLKTLKQQRTGGFAYGLFHCIKQ